MNTDQKTDWTQEAKEIRDIIICVAIAAGISFQIHNGFGNTKDETTDKNEVAAPIKSDTVAAQKYEQVRNIITRTKSDNIRVR